MPNGKYWNNVSINNIIVINSTLAAMQLFDGKSQLESTSEPMTPKFGKSKREPTQMESDHRKKK